MKLIAVTLICSVLTVYAKPVNILKDLEETNNNIWLRSDIDTLTTIEKVDKAKFRVKRDEGGNKYIEATRTGQLKTLRLFLQGIKNIVVSDGAVGGSHPLAVNSVKPLIALFKHKFVKFFFPDVGDNPYGGEEKKQ